MAMANLTAILDPEIVVLGGAIAEARDLLLEPASTEMARRVPPAMAEQVAVVSAALGDDSAAVGAARAALLASQVS
jgi:glucokinase